MKHTIFILVLSVVLLTQSFFALSKANQWPQIDKMESQEVPRGGSVSFIGKNFPPFRDSLIVLLDGHENGYVCYADSYKLGFCISDTIPLGNYNVTIWLKLKDGRKMPIPSVAPLMSLSVISEYGKLEPKITEIDPSYAYPQTKVFHIIGSGFSKIGPDNKLIIKGKGEEPVAWRKTGESEEDFLKRDTALIHGEVVSDRKLTFSNISHDYSGHMSVMIRVGNFESEPVKVNFLRYSKSLPMLFAFIGFLLIVGSVYLIAFRGKEREVVEGQPVSRIFELLIDKETDTLSLAKFQFFVWTAVALFGYLYLMLSRSLIQGSIEFVDIPEGLPGILLISASTSVFSVGITNIKGSKGSGIVHPSWSDLLTNGGLLAPERFQFFIWTVVGAISFIVLVVSQKPENILDLPKVPAGFLQLMGVSSLGYLGGKLARQAGPIIDSVKSEGTNGKLLFTIYGRNLSPSAGFQIDEKDIDSADFRIQQPPADDEKDELSTNKSLLKVLHLEILKNQEELKQGKKLTIINPDGQKAEAVLTPISTID
jgi:hypothetical protein